MTTRWLLLAGTKSIAPWTVEKSPLPSAATVTALALAAGPAALVENRQEVPPAMPVKLALVASRIAPGSTTTW